MGTRLTLRLEGIVLAAASIVLVDTMIVLEAIDTACWRAITGQLRVATSAECAEELQRGDTSRPGYIPVDDEDIERATVVEPTLEEQVAFTLRYPDAHRLDAGERDLLTIATNLSGGFRLCGCDKAAVVAAHSLGLLDRVVSLESLADEVGVRPRRAFKTQYTERLLGVWRTSLMLGRRP